MSSPKQTRSKTRIAPVLRVYAKAATRYPLLLTGVVAGGLGIEAASIIGPLFFKEFVDTIATGNPSTTVTQALFIILAGYAAVMLAGWAARRVSMLCVLRIEAAAPADLTNQAFAHLNAHSYEFFTDNFTGTLTRRISRYGKAFEQVFDGIMLSLFPTALFAAGAITILFLRNPWLGLGMLAWTVLFIGLQIVMTRWRYHFKIERAAADSKMTGILSDAIGNHSSVMLFAAEKHEEGILADAVRIWRIATTRSWNADMFNYAIQGLLATTVEIGLLMGAVYLWNQGLLTVGDFVLIQVYILSLIERIWGIGGTIRRLYDSFADAYEMVEIMEKPHAVEDAAEAQELVLTAGAISFDKVSFSFDEGRPILQGLDLSIAGGEKVAFVGPSGAGKSTITRLLLRFYDTTGGAVRIDGQDIHTVTQESLRSQIAFVPQEPALFHRTLHENIAYGRPDASREAVIEAAKKAHCDEFISGLPEGYDTYVGERGVKLSGGERQRVAIARAILKDAPILVLDEATSSLDSKSEALIQDALRVLMEGKTVIVIAHRLSTIMRMDRIIVIEQGAIAASGTHDDLLNEEGGLYKKLWSIQAGGFITE